MRTSALYDKAAPKRAVNIGMNAELLARLREAGLNVSALAEEAAAAALARLARQRFEEQLQADIATSTALIEEWGDLGEAVRAMGDGR
ncbi:type II toxin-antitoxin system CcdA family antitoxin [Roseicella aquatilis]|uniref:type II toxin-antitoxin system CcdA family antitoxin n=1 Tax=Roseicella aquatilis TaxID=2527868 RepID=UPI0019810576|nr:type II toxin-antitoxin system CcdA family antitoxin [Roseicella aquatilis]